MNYCFFFLCLKYDLLSEEFGRKKCRHPIIDTLPRGDRLYLLEAIENNTLKDAAGETIYSIGVELEDSSLTEVDKTEEDDY